MTAEATALDARNMAFWNELCGSNLARTLGITDASAPSLRRFDDWYFAYYPYLAAEVGLDALGGQDVLEVGLGYGSLSQKIAEQGARYRGLDIAAGPVAMVSHRLALAGLPGRAEQGSILAAPFGDGSFDRVIAIGCLHHVGDMARGIEECRRLLRPGGSLCLMVYNGYSYRRWLQAPRETGGYLLREAAGHRGVVGKVERRALLDYDGNAAGEPAPHTDFISVRSLRFLCRRFRRFACRRRNISQEPPFSSRTREALLRTRWPDLLGLDLYATAVK